MQSPSKVLSVTNWNIIGTTFVQVLAVEIACCSFRVDIPSASQSTVQKQINQEEQPWKKENNSFWLVVFGKLLYTWSHVYVWIHSQYFFQPMCDFLINEASKIAGLVDLRRPATVCLGLWCCGTRRGNEYRSEGSRRSDSLSIICLAPFMQICKFTPTRSTRTCMVN